MENAQIVAKKVCDSDQSPKLIAGGNRRSKPMVPSHQDLYLVLKTTHKGDPNDSNYEQAVSVVRNLFYIGEAKWGGPLSVLRGEVYSKGFALALFGYIIVNAEYVEIGLYSPFHGDGSTTTPLYSAQCSMADVAEKPAEILKLIG